MTREPQPSDLLDHLLEAWADGDEGRGDRILRKARRRSARVTDAVEEALARSAAARSEDHAALLVRCAVDLAVAARCAETLVPLLLALSPSDGMDDTTDEEYLGAALVEEGGDGWPQLVLEARDRAIAAVGEPASDLPPEPGSAAHELHALCVRLLADAPVGTPTVLDALMAGLTYCPADSALMLETHGDRSAAEPLLAWLRGLPDPAALPTRLRFAAEHVAFLVSGTWDATIPASDLRRISELLSLHVERLQGVARSLHRGRRRSERRGRRLPGLRTVRRLDTGPNAPCACGSGLKTKRCCG